MHGWSIVVSQWTLILLFVLQVKRRQWKLELIAELARLTTAEPIPLPLE